jgi:hypothetical protein
MLDSNLTVRRANLTTAHVLDVYALTNIDAQKSTRILVVSPTERKTLSVSTIQSNENGAVPTDRHLIRIDHVIVDATTGENVTCSVYLVVAAPRYAAFTAAKVMELVTSVFSVALATGDSSDYDTQTMGADSIARLGKILNGEP